MQAERKKAIDDLKDLEKEVEKLRKLTEAQRKQLDDMRYARQSRGRKSPAVCQDGVVHS
jgi:septal ring factor EnvC (AmiA/AmiB activator)